MDIVAEFMLIFLFKDLQPYLLAFRFSYLGRRRRGLDKTRGEIGKVVWGFRAKLRAPRYGLTSSRSAQVIIQGLSRVLSVSV